MFCNQSFNGISSIIVTLVVLVSYSGMQDSAIVNNIILVVNVAALIVGIIIGLCYFKLENISGMFDISLREFTETVQLCFFVFLGYDNAACFTEESKNPKKDIPFAMKAGLFVSISINSLLGFALLGMAGPNNLKTNFAFLNAFDAAGLKGIGYVITLGPLLGLLSALICGVNGVVKILYYMADDKLVYKGFMVLYGPKKVPLNSLLISGLLVLLFSSCLSLESLEETVSLCCLVEYTSVSIGLLLIKYKSNSNSSLIRLMIVAFVLLSYFVGLSIYYSLGYIVTVCTMVILLLIGMAIKIQRVDVGESSNWIPFVPLLGGFLNIGFGGILGFTPAMLIFVVYLGLCLVYYFTFSVKHSKLNMLSRIE